MGENTKIEWATHSWNPWTGCTKISPGCDNCYAEAWAKWTGNAELWRRHRRRTSASNWRKPIKWNREAVNLEYRPRVFCASLADVFDNQVPREWRDDLFALIKTTQDLDWLLLTKRPQNILKMLPAGYEGAWNVWLGTTVEHANELRRIDHLRAVPCHVRFLSCEPLIGPIEPDLTGIDWVICGGESGHHARLMDPAWARSLRDQCAAAGVAFFMKQMTAKAEIPPDLMVRQFPEQSGLYDRSNPTACSG